MLESRYTHPLHSYTYSEDTSSHILRGKVFDVDVINHTIDTYL